MLNYNTGMKPFLTTLRAACILGVMATVLSAPPLFGQAAPAPQAPADVAGQWDTEFTTPAGPQPWDMYVVQNGTRLTGRMTSDSGEYPITGTQTGDQFQVTWQHADQGRMVVIVFKATAKGDTLEGTATLTGYGDGTFYASRTGR
jgi:hypothetical protein